MFTHAVSQRTLIVGTSNFARLLMTELLARPGCGYTIIGAVADTDLSDMPEGSLLLEQVPLLGKMKNFSSVITRYNPDRIIVSPGVLHPGVSNHHLLETRVYKNIRVEEASRVYEKITGKLPIETLSPNVISLTDSFQPRRFSQFMARMMSLVFALFCTVLLAPLCLLIAIAIKLDSPGPVLFVQKRIGIAGKSFKLLKFRTMRLCKETTSEWAGDNDHRITRSGRWLRKFRLDEIPQFINVLTSDMNLVGPRPHPLSNFEMLTLVSRNLSGCGSQIPFYTLRLRVKPGITGWAQVRYQYANDLGEELEKLRFDLYYIKHYSLWLDIRILFETIRIVLKGHEVGCSTQDSANLPLPVPNQRSSN